MQNQKIVEVAQQEKATTKSIEKMTKEELKAKLEEVTIQTKKVFNYAQKLQKENIKIKSTNLLHHIISDEGIDNFSIKNYIQNELVIQCHHNQNHIEYAMTRKDEFMLLFVTNIYMINNYCDYLNIEEDTQNGIYKVTLNPDKMTDKTKQFFNSQKDCNFTTDKQILEKIKQDQLNEIESILNNYGYSIYSLEN